MTILPGALTALLVLSPRPGPERSPSGDGPVPVSATTPPAATRPLPGTLRIGVETGAGLVGGAIVGGLAVLGLRAALASRANGTAEDADARRLGLRIGAPAGVTVGAPIAVSLTGRLLGRPGNFLVSCLGSLAGLALGSGIYGLSTAVSDGPVARGTYVLALVLPVAGAVAGHEWSAQPKAAAPSSGVVWFPSFQVGAGFAAGGIAGAF